MHAYTNVLRTWWGTRLDLAGALTARLYLGGVLGPTTPLHGEQVGNSQHTNRVRHSYHLYEDDLAGSMYVLEVGRTRGGSEISLFVGHVRN